MQNLVTNQTEQNIVEDNIIKDIRNLFTSEKKNKTTALKTEY